MLKNKEIIDKLSAKQKFALLADLHALSDSSLSELGIPTVAVKTVDEVLEQNGRGLSSAVLARTWDTELIESLIADALTKENPKKPCVLIVPSPKMKIDLNSSAQSEDTILSEALSLAYLNGAKKAGAVGCISDFLLTREEADQLDEQMDHRVFMEYFIKPFRNTVESSNCHAICGSVFGPGGSYGNLNEKLLNEAEHRIFKRPLHILCDVRTADETMTAFGKGYILMNGSSSTLELAYEQYLMLKKSIEEGRLPMEALEDAYENGSAISDDMLDASVDRLIDFAMFCAEKAENVEKSEGSAGIDLYERAFKESVVLLKNEKTVLPVGSDKKIAVIGSVATAEKDENGKCFAEYFCEALGNPCVGSAAGYRIERFGRNDCIKDALKAAADADIVFVFLGISRQNGGCRKNTLPAGQIELLDVLSSHRDRVIAVLDSDHAVDLQFDKYVGGLLLASLGDKSSAEALARIVSGRVCPNGKLNESYYDDPETFYQEQAFYKNEGRNKVGPFLGYRRYDSTGVEIRYPFGFGLSYADVRYFDLNAHGREISFTVENKSPFRAEQTVQIYIGKSQSAFPRPLKELKAFRLVQLDPHQRVKVSISRMDFSIHQSELACLEEEGVYTVGVATSLTDVKLVERIEMSGTHLESSESQLADYLQSESNILSDSYTMEASFSKMKAYKKWYTVATILLIAGGGLSLSGVSSGMVGQIIFGAVMLIVGLISLSCGNKSKKEYLREWNEARRQGEKELFSGADVVNANDIANLFMDEFDRFAHTTENTERKTEADAQFQRVNQDITYESMSRDFTKFALDRGLRLQADAVGALLASLSSSRFVLIDPMYRQSAARLIALLTEYFGCENLEETVTDGHLEGGKLFVVKGEDGLYAETNLTKAVYRAKENPDTVSIVYLRGLVCEHAEKLLTPFVRYFNSPSRPSSIDVHENGTIYSIPENLWFIVELADGQRVDCLPPYLMELSSVLQVSVEECDPVEEPETVAQVGYYTVRHLIEMGKSRYEVKEAQWKKIDDLEAYVNSYARYQIGNKLWLQLERYASVYNLCGQNALVAIDCAMASNLIPVLTAVLKDKIPSDGKTLREELEQLFGEENISACRRFMDGLNFGA